MTYAYPLDGSKRTSSNEGVRFLFEPKGKHEMSAQDQQLPLNGEEVPRTPGPDAASSEWEDTSAWYEDDGVKESFEVEATLVGPQGVMFPKDPYIDPDAPISQLVADDEEYSSPEERAQTRFGRLSTAFSATLVIVGQMYRDEDWRYLRKEDGTEYKSLVEVCQVAMGKSVAMARRYVQGARDFYLPLSAVMVQGTRLEITSGDIATLGADGIRSVVEDATDRLRGVEDPDEATEIVSESLATARSERERTRSEASGSSGDWDDGASPREYHEPPESDASGPVYSFEGDEDDDEAPGLSGAASAPATSVSGSSYFADEDDDMIAPLLVDAPLFSDEEEMGRLSVPVRRVVRAMILLENVDVSEIAHALDYDNRGIIVHSDNAQKALARIRSMAETQPWVMKRMGNAE